MTSSSSSMDSLLRAVASAPAAMPTTTLRAALAGRYSVERLLGEGGMGSVYLAREVELDRPVALKVIRSDLAADEGFRARLTAEAKIAAGLAHPNVVPVHRIDDVGGVLLMVMAFVDGTSLRERVRQGPLPAREAVAILRDVAWALAHAHAAGVVHRDVKPDNVLVEHNTGRVFVADFGIAARRTSGDAAGTRGYMSPEQASGGDVDGRSDLYALGVTAWELLTGAPPQVPLQEPLLGVPDAVSALVERLLRADPAERPQSAGDVARALNDVIEGPRVPRELRAFAEGDAGVDAGFLTLLVPLSVVGMLFEHARWAPALALLYSLARRLMRVRALLRSGHRVEDLCAAIDARLDESALLLAARVPPLVQSLQGVRMVGATIIAATVPLLAVLSASEEDMGGGAAVFAVFALIGAVGVLLLGASSIALGLAGPTPAMGWRERTALRARRAWWSSRAAAKLAAMLAGRQRAAPKEAHVERHLAVAATMLLTKKADAQELRSLVAALETVATKARAEQATQRLVTAVTHLERIKLALEDDVDVAHRAHEARRFITEA